MSDAAVVVTALREAGATIATAESLTGGLVCSTLVDVPGASDVVRGGIVAYAADLKASLLGVSDQDITGVGTVHPSIAEQMALGARERLAVTYAVATTGVAGPDPSEDHPAGTVFIAVAGPDHVEVRPLQLEGSRAEIRTATTDAVLDLLLEHLQQP